MLQLTASTEDFCLLPFMRDDLKTTPHCGDNTGINNRIGRKWNNRKFITTYLTYILNPSTTSTSLCPSVQTSLELLHLVISQVLVYNNELFFPCFSLSLFFPGLLFFCHLSICWGKITREIKRRKMGWYITLLSINNTWKKE